MEDNEFFDSDKKGGVPEKKEIGIRKPSLKQVSILYSVSILLFLVIGTRVQSGEFFSGILVTEFVLVLLPPIIFLTIYKYDVLKVLRIQKISFVNCILVFWIMIFSLPLVGVINIINTFLIKWLFGKVSVLQLPIPPNTSGLILSVLVIGGSAGICEEVLFRGVIQRGYERFGAAKSIIITALLFGLMHLDFERLAGTFLLGAIIGFLVYRSNSIFSGILAHFTNNSIAVVITYFTMINDFPSINGAQSNTQIGINIFNGMSPTEIYFVVLVWVLMLIFFAMSFSMLIYAFVKNTSNKVEDVKMDDEPTNKLVILWMVPAFLVIGIAFLKQGLSLKGIDIPLLDSFFRLLGAV